MIPLSLRVLAVSASLAYLLAVVHALRRSRMSIRQSLLWLACGAVFLGASLVPEPLLWLAHQVGFQVPSNAAFATWLLALTALVFYQSLVTSTQSQQIKTLCQELALLAAEQPSPGTRRES
jgi:hypothetical protein